MIKFCFKILFSIKNNLKILIRLNIMNSNISNKTFYPQISYCTKCAEKQNTTLYFYRLLHRPKIKDLYRGAYSGVYPIGIVFCDSCHDKFEKIKWTKICHEKIEKVKDDKYSIHEYHFYGNDWWDAIDSYYDFLR